MIRKIRAFLGQPHPDYQYFRIYFRTITGISIIVFLILLILRPFDIGHRNIQNSAGLTALVYAGGAFITMLVSYVWILLFPVFFTSKYWTLGKELIFIVYQMSSIAMTVWLINLIRGTMYPDGNTFLRALIIVVSIGILPYILITLIRHNYLLNQNFRSAKELNLGLGEGAALPNKNENILVVSKLLVPVHLSEFYFAESKGNNLHVFVVKDGQPLEYVIRCTISEFENDNSCHSQIFRCHRSFIINLDKVKQIEGNTTGYRLWMHQKLSDVQVSRSNVFDFKQKINFRNNESGLA
ncbi:LytTR family DNA-binding domain-containing protein [Belliella marina]|uniref:LytTR family DNA-binding domain-containing protein n=1 Tax=Belliella marina TaxID=1644146 RepID=A0ABW4VRQ6_9BACT